MPGGHNLILCSPDSLHRYLQRRQLIAQHFALLAIREYTLGQLLQCLRYTIQTLVLEDILDQLPGNQSRIGKQLLQHRFHIAPTLALNKPFDIALINIRA